MNLAEYSTNVLDDLLNQESSIYLAVPPVHTYFKRRQIIHNITSVKASAGALLKDFKTVFCQRLSK